MPNNTRFLTFPVILIASFLATSADPVETKIEQSMRRPVVIKPASREPAIRIVSANLRSVRGGDTEPSKTEDSWKYRHEICRDVLAAKAADIYCFQECRTTHLRYFQNAMPDYEYFAKARTSGKGAPGNAIFFSRTRFEKLDGGGLWLSETPEVAGSKSWSSFYARHANWVHLKDRLTGHEFIVWNAHLDHATQPAREGQIKVIIDHAASMPGGLGMIIAGDLNAGANNPVYKLLIAAGWQDTYAATHHGNAEPGPTFHGFRNPMPQGSRIDWILTKGSFAALEAEVVKDHKIIKGVLRYPSDHFFIYADLVCEKPENKMWENPDARMLARHSVKNCSECPTIPYAPLPEANK